MIARHNLSPSVILLTTVLTFTFLLNAQTDTNSGPLTIADVVKLCKAGLTDELVITKIKKNNKSFDLSPDELIELRKSGVSDTVIKFLLDPAQPYVPPPPPPAPAPAPLAANPTAAPPPPLVPAPPVKEYPPDAYAAKIPGEPGVYYIAGEAPVKVEIRTLLGIKEGAGLRKVLMKKGKAVGYLVAPASKNRVPNPSPSFYIRLPEGKAMEDVALLALDPKNDRREIEMGPPGPKPEIKAEAMRPFDSLEVGPHLFRATAAKLGKGEYLFFLLGSAEPPKGSFGKGYDFGIDAPPPPRKK
jgi:hypothetical protein